MKSDGPLKIAVFSDSALPILNGVSVSIDQMIRQFRHFGHSVHLFTSGYPGHSETDPNTHRFFAAHTPFARDYPLSLPPFYPWLREFRRHDFDIVHTHTPFTVGFVGLRWAESHEIPIVSTYHTHYDKYEHYIPVFPKAYVRYKIAKHLNYYYNSVDHVVTPSEASRKWLQRHAVRKPVSVIPTGIPLAKNLDRSEIRTRLGVSPDQKVILYAGRVAREKNLDVFFATAQVVMSKNPHAVLWIVGDGPAKERYRRMANELRIGDRTTFFGFVPRADVDQFYAAADLFLFASQTETQGLVVSEAMSYGLPAVVVNSGGAAEAVSDSVNGYRVSNSPAELSGAVLRILENEQLRLEFGVGARSAALELSIPYMAQSIIDVYRGVISNFCASGIKYDD